MQLKERDGIACDQCGTSYRHDFVYYSFDFRQVDVIGNRKPSLDSIFHQPIIASIDVCSTCFNKISNDVIDNYNKILSPIRRTRVETTCELSGLVMAGNYAYYHINVTEVVVRVSDQFYMCIKCKNKIVDVKKQCSKCDGIEFSRPMSTKMTDRFVEINVCVDVYKKMLETATRAKQIANTWSTKS